MLSKKDVAIGGKVDFLLLLWSITQLTAPGHFCDQREIVRGKDEQKVRDKRMQINKEKEEGTETEAYIAYKHWYEETRQVDK